MQRRRQLPISSFAAAEAPDCAAIDLAGVSASEFIHGWASCADRPSSARDQSGSQSKWSQQSAAAAHRNGRQIDSAPCCSALNQSEPAAN